MVGTSMASSVFIVYLSADIRSSDRLPFSCFSLFTSASSWSAMVCSGTVARGGRDSAIKHTVTSVWSGDRFVVLNLKRRSVHASAEPQEA